MKTLVFLCAVAASASTHIECYSNSNGTADMYFRYCPDDDWCSKTVITGADGTSVYYDCGDETKCNAILGGCQTSMTDSGDQQTYCCCNTDFCNEGDETATKAASSTLITDEPPRRCYASNDGPTDKWTNCNASSGWCATVRYDSPTNSVVQFICADPTLCSKIGNHCDTFNSNAAVKETYCCCNDDLCNQSDDPCTYDASFCASTSGTNGPTSTTMAVDLSTTSVATSVNYVLALLLVPMSLIV